MIYKSTRGHAERLSFDEVLLTGLASDGGLYLPERWPKFSNSDWLAMKGLSYEELAALIVEPFIGDSLIRDNINELIRDSYKHFTHRDRAPLVNISRNMWLMELFHGPTLAFKDYALQVLGNSFDKILTEKGTRVTIVGATSGDTGSAAIAACANRESIDIFILHPKGRVSDFQRRQMTTVDSSNVNNIAINGTFDDCQALVKLMFKDSIFKEKLNLSAVNSINWARILFQIVYYVYAALSLGAPNSSVVFSVTTGNFGYVFAGYCAKRMGLPIDIFLIGSNSNDILTRFLENGIMKVKDVIPTISPAMDIQVSSNFERLLYDLYSGDSDAVAGLMQELAIKGQYQVIPRVLKKIQSNFIGGKLDDEGIKKVMKKYYNNNDVLLDPHTAIAVDNAEKFNLSSSLPCIILSTAHPAKFSESVKSATGVSPEIPDTMRDIYDLKESFVELPNDLQKVKKFILNRSRL